MEKAKKTKRLSVSTLGLETSLFGDKMSERFLLALFRLQSEIIQSSSRIFVSMMWLLPGIRFHRHNYKRGYRSEEVRREKSGDVLNLWTEIDG